MGKISCAVNWEWKAASSFAVTLTDIRVSVFIKDAENDAKNAEILRTFEGQIPQCDDIDGVATEDFDTSEEMDRGSQDGASHPTAEYIKDILRNLVLHVHNLTIRFFFVSQLSSNLMSMDIHIPILSIFNVSELYPDGEMEVKKAEFSDAEVSFGVFDDALNLTSSSSFDGVLSRDRIRIAHIRNRSDSTRVTCDVSIQKIKESLKEHFPNRESLEEFCRPRSLCVTRYTHWLYSPNFEDICCAYHSLILCDTLFRDDPNAPSSHSLLSHFGLSQFQTLSTHSSPDFHRNLSSSRPPRQESQNPSTYQTNDIYFFLPKRTSSSQKTSQNSAGVRMEIGDFEFVVDTHHFGVLLEVFQKFSRGILDTSASQTPSRNDDVMDSDIFFPPQILTISEEVETPSDGEDGGETNFVDAEKKRLGVIEMLESKVNREIEKEVEREIEVEKNREREKERAKEECVSWKMEEERGKGREVVAEDDLFQSFFVPTSDAPVKVEAIQPSDYEKLAKKEIFRGNFQSQFEDNDFEDMESEPNLDIFLKKKFQHLYKKDPATRLSLNIQRIIIAHLLDSVTPSSDAEKKDEILMEFIDTEVTVSLLSQNLNRAVVTSDSVAIFEYGKNPSLDNSSGSPSHFWTLKPVLQTHQISRTPSDRSYISSTQDSHGVTNSSFTIQLEWAGRYDPKRSVSLPHLSLSLSADTLDRLKTLISGLSPPSSPSPSPSPSPSSSSSAFAPSPTSSPPSPSPPPSSPSHIDFSAKVLRMQLFQRSGVTNRDADVVGQESFDVPPYLLLEFSDHTRGNGSLSQTSKMVNVNVDQIQFSIQAVDLEKETIFVAESAREVRHASKETSQNSNQTFILVTILIIFSP